MRRALLLVVAGAALAFPAAAFAHASLQREHPSFRERLSASPRVIVLDFDQQVSLLPDAIEVLTLKGKNVAGPARVLKATRQLIAPLPKLPRGPYTVRWKAVSNDGHVVSGVWTFGVGVPAPLVTDAVGAQGPTTQEHVLRWAYFLALALLVGGLGFRLFVVRGPLPPRAEKRFYRVAGIGVVGVLEVGIVAFLFRAEDALQLPFSRFLYGDLSPISNGTRFGQAFIVMTLGFALVAAALYLAWLTDRAWLLWIAFALGVFFASGLSLSGHATESGKWAELGDWVHLTAAMLWLGGLVQLVLVVYGAAPALRRVAFLRFSQVATVLVALLLGAGIYLSVLRLPQVSDLWNASYGRILLVKLALVSVALLWGAAHHFLVRPRMQLGPSDTLLARLPRSLLGESLVGMAILLVAAVLVDSKPPPKPVPAPAAASTVQR
jgi:copper transport protein